MWWLVACAPAEAPVDPVHAVPVVEVPAERPARHAADVATLWTDPDHAPPLSLVRRRLCVNAPGVRNAVAEQIRTRREDPLAHELLVVRCDDPSWCRWLRSRATGDVPDRGSAWWTALAQDCDDPVSQAEVEGAGYELWLWSLDLGHLGAYDPRIATATVQAMAHGDRIAAEAGLRALAWADGPEAERDLLAMYRAVPPIWRDRVALSLWGRPSDEAFQALAGVCARNPDPRCSWTRRSPLDPEEIRYRDDPEALYDELPDYETAVTEALQSCAADPALGRRCAEALVRHGAPVDLSDPAYADLLEARGLGDALVPKLVGAGVPLDPATPPGLVTDLLVEAGLARPLSDLWWDEDPAWMLLGVAALAGEPGLGFDALPPSPDAPPIQGRTPGTALLAWDGTRRWRALALPPEDEETAGLGDVVGFANAVLERVGSGKRAAVDRDHQVVVVAPKGVLQALSDQHLVAFDRFEPEQEEE